MRTALQLAMVAASVATLLAVMAGVRYLGRRYDWSAELQRKCVHVATGLYALTLPFIFPDRWPVAVLIGAAIAVMLALRLKSLAANGIGSALHGVGRASYGELLLAVAIGFTFFRSEGYPVLFVLPVAVMTLSDAAAALVGVSYGRRKFEVEQGVKSLEGTVMFFLVTWILAMVILLLMTSIDRPNVVLLGLLIAAFGAMVEAESWRGFDNLFVPVGVQLFLESYFATSPLSLLVLTAGFLAAVGGILLAAPVLKLTSHAARSSAILVFLILSVTGAQNAVAPIAALIAHIYARSVRPCQSEWPDLDFLAVATGIGLFWLLTGDQMGRNALNVFNLTFAGMAAILVMIALRGRLMAVGALAIGLLGWTVLAIADFNHISTRWHGYFLPWVVVALTFSSLVAWRWPEWFDNWRSPRAALVALIVPVTLYLGKAVLA